MSDETRTTVEPLTLTTSEFIALANVSKSKFYAMKRTGLLKGLESKVPRRWNRTFVEAWLSGRDLSDRRRTRVA